MSNSLLTDSVIARETMRELKNQLVFTKSINREYDDRFAAEGAKIGDTLNLRLENQYTATDGATLNIQDTTDRSVALVIDSQKHVGMAFSDKDRALSLDKFNERIIKPAVKTLANAVDYANLVAAYQSVYNSVGVPSATAFPSDLKGFGQAKAKLAHSGAPIDELTALVDPDVEASLVHGLKGLFQSSEQIAKQYEKGVMGMAAGSKFKMSQNVPKHTIGALGGTPAVKTTITTQGASTIAVDGSLGASVSGYFKKGDVITIGGVYAVNPLTKQKTGALMQFVVTEDADADTNEIAELNLSPAMYSTGAQQNVDALPVDGGVITCFGHASSYAGIIAPQNLVFHKDAFAMACVDLPIIRGAHMCERVSDKDSGLSIRLWSAGDIVNSRLVTRLDILYGFKSVQPGFGCRVVGQPA